MTYHSHETASTPMRPLLALALAASLAACDTGGPPEPPGPPADPALGAWLAERAHPLDTAAPRDDVSDLRFLDDLVGDARVVALGEATHGTREFFQIKDRVVRYLVDELGFDALVFEADAAAGVALDRYVRGGTGDAADLLAGTRLWPWQTEEVAALVGGLRARNAAGADVGFYGADVQFPALQADLVAQAVRSAEPDSAAAVEEAYRCLVDLSQPTFEARQAGVRAYPDRPAAEIARCRARVQEVRAYLERRSGPLGAALGARGYAGVLDAAVAAEQGELAWGSLNVRSTNYSYFRDRAMADNVLRVLDRLGEGGRVVVWAHNVHVSESVADLPTMGEFLDEALGDRYRSVGFAFQRGAVQSVQIAGGLRPVEVGDGPADGYGALLASAGLPLFALDLRGLDGPGAALAGPRPFRQYGARVEPGPVGPARLADWFDAVVFVETSTPSRPLAGAAR